MKNLLLFFVFVGFSALAQLDQYEMYVGVTGFSRNKALNQRGITTNAFSDFSSVAMVGAGGYMYVTDHLRLGGNIETMVNPAEKKNFTMSFFSIKPTATFHFLSFAKRFSPFVSLSLNTTFLNLERKANVDTLFPKQTYSVTNGTNVLIVSEVISSPYFKMQYQPIVGAGLDLGCDIRLKKHLGLILSVGTNRLYEKTNAAIRKNLENNKFNLDYTTINLKLRYRLF